jgi:glutaredoxin
MIEIVLYTKPGCCLCDMVKTQLRKVRASQPFALREVNILQDNEAYAQFHEEIPVVFINGRKAFTYHLDEGVLLQQLKSLATEGEQPEHGS